METSQRGNRGDAGELNPFQFSLAGILIICTILAVCLSAVTSGPPWVVSLTMFLLSLAVPMSLTVTLVYGRGYLRTFCIGALFPCGVMLMGTLSFSSILFMWSDFGGRPSRRDTGMEFLIGILICGVVIVAFGLLAMLIRWRLEAPLRAANARAATRQLLSGGIPTLPAADVIANQPQHDDPPLADFDSEPPADEDQADGT